MKPFYGVFQTFSLSNYAHQQASGSPAERSAFAANFLASQLPGTDFFQPSQASVITNSGQFLVPIYK